MATNNEPFRPFTEAELREMRELPFQRFINAQRIIPIKSDSALPRFGYDDRLSLAVPADTSNTLHTNTNASFTLELTVAQMRRLLAVARLMAEFEGDTIAQELSSSIAAAAKMGGLCNPE